MRRDRGIDLSESCKLCAGDVSRSHLTLLNIVVLLFCLVCPKGYRVNDAGDGCVICPNNTYSDTIDAGSCKPCGMYSGSSQFLTGQVSEAGSTSSSDCCKKLYISILNFKIFQIYFQHFTNINTLNVYCDVKIIFFFC